MLSLELRPRRLGDVIGQKKTIEDLKARAANMSFPQVIFFEGATGSGKTTCAMIIAQTLNCENPVMEDGYYSPCQECASCKDIISGRLARSVSVYDCSEMGKEDVLKLKDKLSMRPLYDKNNILILDEAQNLGNAKTKGALLLLLEKEWKNSYIFLNTMDASKFERAILGRGQRFTFKPVGGEDLLKYLFDLTEKTCPGEEIPESFYTEVLPSLVNASLGSVREALQMFERCTVGKIYTKVDFIEAFNLIDQQTVFNLLLTLLNKKNTFFSQLDKYIVSYFAETAGANKTSLSKATVNELAFKGFFEGAWTLLMQACILEKGDDASDKILETKNAYELLDTFARIHADTSGEVNYRFFCSSLVESFIKVKPKKLEEVPSIPKRPVRPV